MRNSTLQTIHAQQGLSLIEIMIAMVVGLLLVGGMITVFAGSKRSAELNKTMAMIQENGRFALSSMVSDVRLAGFQGCTDSRIKARIRATLAPTSDFSLSNISSSLINADGSWAPAAPLNFVPPTTAGSPLPGTYALSVQFGSPETRQIQAMANVSTDVVIAGSDPAIVTTGDLALISNCQVADIFMVTNAANGVLKHAAVGNGGNNRLSAPYGQTSNERARIMRFEANIYYVGNTQRTNAAGEPVYALYRQSWPYDRPPVEMVEGVSNMKVRLGFRNPDGNSNLNYVSPEDSAAASGRVESVEIGILMQSFEQVAADTDNRAYLLAGTTLSPGSSSSSASTHYIADRSLRLAFGSTVSIRNRR
ncbi:PilW family protein [Granulosicoccus antarcticus]|uniref:PilW family protein n=1 Tax=Granulosicoccus antarcticus TaxID=437505 RepID=UPI000B5A2F80|nr:PilW family protein [Granulosicoccus antarcticus]